LGEASAEVDRRWVRIAPERNAVRPEKRPVGCTSYNSVTPQPIAEPQTVERYYGRMRRVFDDSTRVRHLLNEFTFCESVEDLFHNIIRVDVADFSRLFISNRVMRLKEFEDNFLGRRKGFVPNRNQHRILPLSDDSVRLGLHAAELVGLLIAEREPDCKLPVSVLDLPEPEAESKRRPLYGPIPWCWWLPASRLLGKTLQVASVCWLLASWNRSAELELALHDWAEFGLSRFSASRALDILERAGLVSMIKRRDRTPMVAILDTSAGAD
jgi:DNA-binding transcriptional ArsR family regulator